jgi:hypothetical protein
MECDTSEVQASSTSEDEEEDDYEIPMICLNKPLPTIHVHDDCTICMEGGETAQINPGDSVQNIMAESHL